MGSIIDDFEGIADRLRKLRGEPKRTLGEELERAMADAPEPAVQQGMPAYVDCPNCSGVGHVLDALNRKELCYRCSGLGKIKSGTGYA